ncbi:MAG: electron transfer flavoprotein subunit beta, partial [Aigarchaeota archaeon]|nr:electron transfer flavoprotein subunit beta [Aigarchaeota archaeon]
KVELHQDLKRVMVHRETDEGYDVVECKLPVLLTAIKGLNEPRLPSLMNILAANRKEIKTIVVADVGGDPQQYGLAGSLTQVVEVFTPEPRGKGIKVDGSNPEDAAKQLVQFLLEKNLL